MTMDLQDFPYALDLSIDPVFQSKIKPFIEGELDKLADLDAARAKYVRRHLPADYELTYYFHEHARRVAYDMRRTCAWIGLPDDVQDAMYWAMLPHDIGKRMLPVALWDSVDKPENEIKALRRTHTDKGLELVEAELGDLDHPFIPLMTDIMRNHHEQMDGNGPHGIPARQLSTPVRLACIIESFDGYTIARHHFGDRDISVAGVLKRMEEEKGAAFYDMDLFQAFKAAKLTAG